MVSPGPVRHPVYAGIAFLAAIVTSVAGIAQVFLDDLPALDPAGLRYRQSVRIFDGFGNDLYRMYDTEDRVTLDGDAVSPFLRQAFVAIEDERFFERSWCIDGVAVARALVKNAFAGGVVEGGSTITQQLVRSVYLSPEKSLRRKVQEAVLACRMESRFSKDEILTLYVNRVPFGGPIYGAERAAEAYFGTSASGLTLAQAAVLAAIPQRPSAYTNPTFLRTGVDRGLVRDLRSGDADPRDIDGSALRDGLFGRTLSTPAGPVRVGGRADAVVNAMRRERFITVEQAEAAHAELSRMTLRRQPSPRTAPHFVETVRLDIEALLETVSDADAWLRSGMRVHTTIHPVLQEIAEETLLEQREYLNDWGARHAAIVVLDRKTRNVLAYAGNIDYDDPDAGAVDMARAPRQTGSAFKPVVYAADMQRTGANSGTFILDGPLGFPGEPKNYEGGYKGWMRIKHALGSSRNVPAVRAFFEAGGEEDVLNIAAAMGVVSPLESRERALLFDPWFSFGWPAALGAAEVPLVELVQAYATIAEGGVYLPLRVVDRIEGQDGEVLLATPRGVPLQAVDAEVAGEIDAILRDPLVRPKGFWRSMLTIPGLDTAAKTGTSNLCLRRDARGRCTSHGVNNVWTVGYDERIVVGVWVGNADNAPLAPTADGLTMAAPVWRIFLERANGLPVTVR